MIDKQKLMKGPYKKNSNINAFVSFCIIASFDYSIVAFYFFIFRPCTLKVL